MILQALHSDLTIGKGSSINSINWLLPLVLNLEKLWFGVGEITMKSPALCVTQNTIYQIKEYTTSNTDQQHYLIMTYRTPLLNQDQDDYTFSSYDDTR